MSADNGPLERSPGIVAVAASVLFLAGLLGTAAATYGPITSAFAPPKVTARGPAPGFGARTTRLRAANDDGPADWFQKTKVQMTPREQLRRYKEANERANNGRERKDLYSDNWQGDRYTGSGFNVLTALALIAVGVPAIGLLIAYLTYGDLWG